MKLIDFQKTKDGKYLKNYELSYENKVGAIKKYEIVSRHNLNGIEELGLSSSGVSIIATCDDKLLLLKEFRMGVNRTIYNLCAGMMEDGETTEECVKRELYEETGLQLKRMKKLLPPSYAAVAISDVSTSIAIVEVEGELHSDHTSANEEILAALYTKEEVKSLLEANEPFSSRAQIAAYFFAIGALNLV